MDSTGDSCPRACILSEAFVENYSYLLGFPVTTPFLLSTRPYESQDILTQNGYGGSYINIQDNIAFKTLWQMYWKAEIQKIG